MNAQINQLEKEQEQKPKKCPQCGKEILSGKEFKDRIRRNRQWVDMEFCSGQCALYYQMGCEG